MYFCYSHVNFLMAAEDHVPTKPPPPDTTPKTPPTTPGGTTSFPVYIPIYVPKLIGRESKYTFVFQYKWWDKPVVSSFWEYDRISPTRNWLENQLSSVNMTHITHIYITLAKSNVSICFIPDCLTNIHVVWFSETISFFYSQQQWMV